MNRKGSGLQFEARAADGEFAPSGIADPRSVPLAMWRGLCLRCPHCGEGLLFRGFLRTVDWCASCGEPIFHHRADDLPPYLTIFIVGHLVVALFMGVEQMVDLSMWTHLAIWIPVTTLLTVVLLKPLKGATVGLQWAMRMHGFGDGDAGADH